MLSTYLAAYPWLAPAIFGAAIVVGLLVAVALSSRRRLAWALAGAALLAVLSTTLYPTGRDLEAGCMLEVELAILAPEPLANVALFIAPALLIAVATRSPALGALSGAALSAGIEALQAVAPVLGRSCALDDWLGNSIGALIGALIAAAASTLSRARTPAPTR